jgi:hypothetical protein
MKTQKQAPPDWFEQFLVEGANGTILASAPDQRPEDFEGFVAAGAKAAQFLQWPRWANSVLPRNSKGIVCPVLDTFMSTWRDSTREADRGRLFDAPVLSMAKDASLRFVDVSNRWWMIADWMCRTALPVVLEHNGLAESAEILRALSPVAEVFSVAQWQTVTTALGALADPGKEATGIGHATARARAGLSPFPLGWCPFYNLDEDKWDEFQWVGSR